MFWIGKKALFLKFARGASEASYATDLIRKHAYVYTWSGDPRGIEKRWIIHLEVALDNRSFGLARPVFGAKQIFGIDFELDALETSDADDRQKHGYQKKVPGVFGDDMAESVEGFRQPFVNALYAARHGVCGEI